MTPDELIIYLCMPKFAIYPRANFTCCG